MRNYRPCHTPVLPARPRPQSRLLLEEPATLVVRSKDRAPGRSAGRSRPHRPVFAAEVSRPPVLPHDGARHGPAAGRSQSTVVSRWLVSRWPRRRGLDAGHLEGFRHDGGNRLPDFFRVVLDPARLG